MCIMEVFVKDMDLHKFSGKFPEAAGVAHEMLPLLPAGYDHYLVDYIVMDCVPGAGTCRDTRWHVDGDPRKDNRYALWVSGPNRTLFLADPFDLPELPEGREDQNILLEETLAGRRAMEVPDGTPFLYDSRTPHRGVVCEKSGRRVFLRLMATNYIKPKNMVRRGQDVPFQPAV
jgi:hypothetical protein